MTSCIGHMGGRGWRAELNWVSEEAEIIDHASGVPVLVATVPLGDFTPETKDWYAALKPDDEQNKRLMMLVFAPDAWRMLAAVEKELSSRCPLEDRGEIRPYQHEREDSILLDEIRNVLEMRSVPEDEHETGDVE